MAEAVGSLTVLKRRLSTVRFRPAPLAQLSLFAQMQAPFGVGQMARARGVLVGEGRWPFEPKFVGSIPTASITVLD